MKRAACIIGLLALALGAGVARAEPPAPPAPPNPPQPPRAVQEDGVFVIPEGETHHGDLRKFSSKVVIEGTLDGDLSVWSGSVEIPGKVTGHVRAVAGSLDLGGEVLDGVHFWGKDTKITGTVRDDLTVVGGTLVLAPGATVDGDVEAVVQSCDLSGTITGDMSSTGGVVKLAGKIGGDARVECETFEIADGARIDGDLDYNARNPVDLTGKEIVGGAVTYGGEETQRARTRRAPRPRSDVDDDGEVPFNLIGFVNTLLLGGIFLALFRRRLAAVEGSLGREPLRSLGVGFLVALSPIAVTFTAILILTIPLVVLYWLAFAFVAFVAKVPVGTWIGGWILARIGRPEAGLLWRFLVGISILYLLFLIPVLGILLWISVSLLGLGALFLGVREMRNARGAAVVEASPEPTPPTLPPAIAAS